MAVKADGSGSHVRIDGHAKVTGAATYAFDHPIPNVAHAAVVTSSIARGEITSFDLAKARQVPGLLRIFTFRDFADSIHTVKHLMSGGYANSSALPLGSSEIHYAGQIIAVAVAESREAAEEAAFLVRVGYRQKPSAGTFGQPGAELLPFASVKPVHKDPAIGDAEQAFSAAPIQVDSSFQTPIQHHNPMELFGTTCVWTGDRLTVYEATRYIDAVQHGLAAQLGIDPANVRVLCPYMGGHFGSRLALSQYTAPIALAARTLDRPVKYVATRPQCFTVANHRPDTQHRIRIASTKDGEFTALLHDAQVTTSRFDDFSIEGTDVTGSLYAWGNVKTSESLVRVDRNTPGPMRAPPEVPYLFALESAIDEVAEKLALDPIELRRRNDTKVDLISGKPFVPRALMDCFDAGAKAFGWLATAVPRRSVR
jgi:xanthine dehydrogenase YagR molybdenum-binding subunit